MATAADGGYARPEMLAETEWLAERLDDPDVRIIDCRDDAASYDASHLPGAVYLNYRKTKAADSGGKRVVEGQEAADLFGALGIGDGHEVVIYDDVGSYAGRIWWTLHHLGHERLRILNGGWKKWTAEKRPVSREVPKPPRATFTPRPRTDDIISADEVQALTSDPGTVIFDTRSGVEYFGVLEKFGYRERADRGGHVPSARWVDWKRSLERDGTMKPARALEQMFRAEGFDPDKTTVVYCQSAARSGHQLFTLRLLGHDNVRNYDGSWKEWGNSERPIELSPHLSPSMTALVGGVAAGGVTAVAALGHGGRVLARKIRA